MNSPAFLCLVLSTLLVLGFGWEGAVKVADQVTRQSFYLDPMTGITHVAWCQKITGSNDIYLFYKQIAADKSQSQGRQMEGVYGCDEISIDGDDNGKFIYISFAGPRVSGESTCNDNKSTGCVDVYFKETKDGGETWTDSVPVHRNDMNDVARRMNLQLIHDKISGRTLLIYLKNDTEQQYTSVYFAQRTKDNDVFTNEQRLLPGQKLRPAMTSTNAGGAVPVLHLAWSELVDGKYLGYYSRSINGGIAWSAPTTLIKRIAGPPLLKFVTSRNTPGMLFMAYPDIRYDKWAFKWTRDQGVMWTTEIAGPKYYPWLAMALYTIPVKGKPSSTVFVLSAGSDAIEFGTYSLDHNTYVQAETPFKQVVSKVGPELACSLSKTKTIILEAIIGDAEGTKSLYFATHEYAPTIVNA